MALHKIRQRSNTNRKLRAFKGGLAKRGRNWLDLRRMLSR